MSSTSNSLSGLRASTMVIFIDSLIECGYSVLVDEVELTLSCLADWRDCLFGKYEAEGDSFLDTQQLGDITHEVNSFLSAVQDKPLFGSHLSLGDHTFTDADSFGVLMTRFALLFQSSLMASYLDGHRGYKQLYLFSPILKGLHPVHLFTEQVIQTWRHFPQIPWAVNSVQPEVRSTTN